MGGPLTPPLLLAARYKRRGKEAVRVPVPVCLVSAGRQCSHRSARLRRPEILGRFSRPLPSALTIACYACAVWLMALATKRLELGLAYASWAAASTAATAVIGIVCVDEWVSSLKLAGLALTVCALVALNLGDAAAR
ncbi:hypothetical protein LGN23_17515 [Burkholderia seminalis]|nr:hypothetical protein [Burkholderia seminalis]